MTCPRSYMYCRRGIRNQVSPCKILGDHGLAGVSLTPSALLLSGSARQTQLQAPSLPPACFLPPPIPYPWPNYSPHLWSFFLSFYLLGPILPMLDAGLAPYIGAGWFAHCALGCKQILGGGEGQSLGWGSGLCLSWGTAH